MKLFTLEADLQLNASDFNTGVNKASEKIVGLEKDFNSAASTAEDTKRRMDIALGTAIGDFIGQMAGAMTEAVFEWTGDGIALASSMQEVANVVDTTFGDNAAKINAWAKTTKSSFGIGVLSAKDYASTMGATLKGMGIEDESLYDMSTALVGLAGDMASFRNLDTATAFRKIMSGMTGEMEPLKDLGIIMSETNLASHALMMGIEGDWAKLDSATKTQVRFNYLMQQTADMQGDFAKTSDSYANQLRLLDENINSLKLALGESILPVVTELVGWFNNLFGAGDDGAESMKNMGTALGETYANINSTATNALALVDALAKMEAQGVDTADEQSVWNQLLANLSNTLPEIQGYIDATTGSINGGTEALEKYVLQWQESQQQMATMAALQNMQNEIAAKATEVSTLQFQLTTSQMTDEQAQQRWFELIAMAGEHYYPDADGYQYANVVSKLQKESKGGDVYAQTILGELADIENREENQAAIEQQLLAAQFELEAMNAKYQAIQTQVDAILADTQEKQAAETEKPAEKPAVPTPVTIILQATLDGQEIAATLTPRVTGAVMNDLDWKFAQIAR